MSPEQAEPVVDAIRSDQNRWVDFMMRFELGLEAPEPKRARQSAATIALSYVAGGLVPLTPYMFLSKISEALGVSVVATLIALFVFGYFKGKFTGIHPFRGGMQTVTVGGLASAAAYTIAKIISA